MQLNTISGMLLNTSSFISNIFARKPRAITECDRWKATKFRQFLLYTGPVVLKEMREPQMYIHFLTLSLGINVLLDENSERRSSRLENSRELLTYFVNSCELFYGETFCVYNVHNLKHVPDDVAFHHCSSNKLSCFPLGNYMHKI